LVEEDDVFNVKWQTEHVPKIQLWRGNIV
jgi:hypothetical protein